MAGSSSTFTCITCQVIFPDSVIQREHYKTDWHRYNLKRKVADLPPVTFDNFRQRCFANLTLTENKSEESDVCKDCRKHFSNRKSFENHLKSKRHQENVRKLQAGEDSITLKKEVVKGIPLNKNSNLVNTLNMKNLQSNPIEVKPRQNQQPRISESSFESVDEDEWEDISDDEEVQIGIEDCLFCSEAHPSLEENIKHMTVAHSFFIPDIEYLTDLEGLISFLAGKISVARICLWCNETGKGFHSTKAVQQHMLDKGHCKILFEGDALLDYIDFYDYSASYPDHQEATNPDEEVTVDVLNGEDYQLVLPSGAVIGHRSLARYYKQNIPPKRNIETKSQRMVQHVLSHYRAIGYSGTAPEIARKHARDVRYLQKIRAKKHMQQGVKNNRLQQHFRLQYRY